MTQTSEQQAVGNGRALIVAKRALIDAKMTEMGLQLRKSRRATRRMDRDSYSAGQSAGERASFGRPIARGAGPALIGAK